MSPVGIRFLLPAKIRIHFTRFYIILRKIFSVFIAAELIYFNKENENNQLLCSDCLNVLRFN